MNASVIHLEKNADVAGMLTGGVTIYRSFRRYFSNTVFVISLLFVSAILAPLVYLFLFFLRRRLQKTYLGDIEINRDNYVAYRTVYGNLTNSINSLKISSTNDDINKIPFFLRYLFKEFLHLYRVLVNSQQQLAATLKSIDNNAPESDFFQLRTESELWNSRNKAYNYL